MQPSAIARRARRRLVVLGAVVLLAGVPRVASSAERERFPCPARGSAGSVDDDPEGAVRAALEGPTGSISGLATIATPKVPGYAGLIAATIGGGASEADGAERADLGVLLPLLRGSSTPPAVGSPLRFPGARRVRVRALLDLAGYDGDIVVGGEEGRIESIPRACPRRPALIVEVRDGPERGADALVMIVSLSGPELRVIHRERSHVGPEGGSTVVALRFRGTRGGSPSDLVVLRRRRSRGGASPVVEEDLFNYVDGRYRSAP